MAARIAVIVLALAGVAGLIALEHGARAADDIATADVQRAIRLARTARHVSPDTQPTLDLGIVYATHRDFPGAGRQFAQVTREEPRNARAWMLLCVVARRYDSGLAATACARERALAPPVPPAR